tara:strand:+ start:731 stop:1747 length:1017 start_codon:yes stop_codon:yes gene_type:complete
MKLYNLQVYDDNIKYTLIYKNLHNELCLIKTKIDDFKNWEHYKKISNLYENIYTNNKKYNICLKNPISRSYFKLCEILYDLSIHKKYENILCIAEAPGGFIEYIGEHDLSDNIYANTYINNKKCPAWNYKSLKKYDNIKYLHKINNDGNLLNINNILDIKENIKKCDLITADGGIDYTNNYNNQELDSYELLYSEIYTTLLLQNTGGIFIIKFFDIFYDITIQLLYILNECYEQIYFIKPLTSRSTNSEKYIVCKNYKKNQYIIDIMKLNWDCKKKLFLKISIDFYNKIYEYNKLFVKNQIDHINKTLQYTNIIDDVKNKYCVEWCIKYNMPYNLKNN